VHCAVLLDASVAVQVTEVVPTGNIEPVGGLHTTVGLAVQLSVAIAGVKLAAAIVANGHEACAVTVTSRHPFGNTGGVLSTTVTLNEQLGPFVVQVTVVMPTGKNDPDAGLQPTVPHPPPVVVGAG
jgi:purine-cytosine permease-like protein